MDRKSILLQIKEQLEIKIAEGWKRFPRLLTSAEGTLKASISVLIIHDSVENADNEELKILHNLMHKKGLQHTDYQTSQVLSLQALSAPPAWDWIQGQTAVHLIQEWESLQPRHVLCFGERARLAFCLLAHNKNLDSGRFLGPDWLWNSNTKVSTETGISVYGLPSLQELVTYPAWRKAVWGLLGDINNKPASK